MGEVRHVTSCTSEVRLAGRSTISLMRQLGGRLPCGALFCLSPPCCMGNGKLCLGCCGSASRRGVTGAVDRVTGYG